MKVDIYSDFKKDLETLWIDFEKNATMTPFQSYAWLAHYHNTVGKPLFDIEIQIVHIHNDAQTIAILPFSIRNKSGIKIMEWLGGINADYMGPLLHPDFNKNHENSNLWTMVKSKLKSYDVIYFRKQPDWVIKFLKQIGFSSSYNQYLKAYKAELPSEWDIFLNGIKKSLRSDSNRQQRRLAKIGNVKFIIAENYEIKKEIILAMITQKRRRYHQKGFWDMLALEKYQQFYKYLASIETEKFTVHCSSLNVGDVKVATHVGIVDRNIFYYLMPANELGKWEKYSPGRLLLIELIKWSINNRLEFFDFTAGDEAYKKYWSNIELDLFETVNPNSFKGKLFYSVYNCRLYIRKHIKLKNILIKKRNWFKNIINKKYV